MVAAAGILVTLAGCSQAQPSPGSSTDPAVPTGTATRGADPAATARIEVMCPDCSGGDFSMPEYFDAAGQQILDF